MTDLDVDYLRAAAAVKIHGGLLLLSSNASLIYAVSDRSEAWSSVLRVDALLPCGDGWALRGTDGDTLFGAPSLAAEHVRALIAQKRELLLADIGVDLIELPELLYVVADTDGTVQELLGIKVAPDDGLAPDRRQLPAFSRAEYAEAIGSKEVQAVPGDPGSGSLAGPPSFSTS